MSWRQVNAIAAGLLLAALLLTSPALISRVLENGSSTPAWWNFVLLAGLAGCAVGLFRCYSKRIDPRLWAGLLAFVCAVAVATFPLIAQSTSRGAEQTWISWVLPIGSASFGIAFSLVPALLCSIGLAGLNMLANAPWVWPQTSYERSQMTAVVLVTMCVMASVGFEAIKTQARTIDEAEARAVESAARAGALVAQQQESAHWDAVIHDDVLATLEAARNGYVGAADLRELAVAAVTAIDHPNRALGLVDGADHIRVRLSRVLELPVELRLSKASDTDPDPGTAIVLPEIGRLRALPSEIVVPGEVLVAIEAAAAEACRNVRRHARVGTKTVVTMMINPTELVVEVNDNGGGFDPGRVPRACMGIGVSIIGRMRAVGGEAVVMSAPGRPTTVSVRWPAAA